MLRWLRLFRVVNLPTVPGDVFVGAAAVLAAGGHPASSAVGLCWGARFLAPVWWAAAASVFIYMFGLAHNDIVGAKTDKGRPIADGEISMDSAWAAAAACLGAAAFCAYFGGLFRGGFLSHGLWPAQALLLVALVVVYNRTKQWWVMGACRGVNVLLGASAVFSSQGRPCDFDMRLLSIAVVWWLYISLVTLYSKGEEDDPAKKRRVGFLVGAIAYLQLAALIVMALAYPRVAGIRTLLVAGAAMLILLRLSTRLLPKVSAS
jgi:4-hydroxybenzoate polyprenyltransferase